MVASVEPSGLITVTLTSAYIGSVITYPSVDSSVILYTLIPEESFISFTAKVTALPSFVTVLPISTNPSSSADSASGT